MVHVGGEPVPGAAEALAKWREGNLSVRFVTNTTSKPASAVRERLEAMGVPVGEGELFTAPLAARALVEERNLRPHLLIAEALEEDFVGIECDEPDAVVVGDAGRAFTWEALNAAYRVLQRPGAALVAMGMNTNYRDADGGLSLDAGPFVRLLAEASGVEPVVTGKPAADFFAAAVASTGLGPGELAMIGDDVEGDVGGAQAAGLRGVLVRTGKFEPAALQASAVEPDAVVNDLAAAVAWAMRRA